MGAYKRDVVVVIKTGAYIHGVLILCGCLLSRFYSIAKAAISNATNYPGYLQCNTLQEIQFYVTLRWRDSPGGRGLLNILSHIESILVQQNLLNMK